MSPVAKKAAAAPAEPEREPEPAMWPFQPKTITKDQAEALRAPFPEAGIGKLPRSTCKACKNATCNDHPRKWCDECQQTGGRHMHLDYVGHAWVTHRLLEVDPLWNWEPVPNSEELGLPTPAGTMWIRLTVCGVERFGVGDAQGKTGPDAVKEMIGDAIRNAAMRFGVALDLWMKDRHAAGGLETTESAPRSRSQSRPASGSTSKRAPAKRAEKRAAERPAAGSIPTGTITQIRQELHDRMNRLPEPHRAKAFELFAKKYGDPFELPASKVANAVLFIGAQQKAAESGAHVEPPEQKPAEEPTFTVEDGLRIHLRAVVDEMPLEDLRAAWDAIESEQAPAEMDAARARLVELSLAELLDEYPEGATLDDVAAWWNGEGAS